MESLVIQMQMYRFECRITLDDVSFNFLVLAPTFVYDSFLFVCVSERMIQVTFLALHAPSAKKDRGTWPRSGRMCFM